MKFISPSERHNGCELQIMKQREKVYAAAKAKNPNRWSGRTRNWNLPEFVALNSEKEEKILAKTG